MRLFLGAYMAHMFYFCGWYGYLQHRSWAGNVPIQEWPLGLPTRAELEQIEHSEHPEGYSSTGVRVGASISSLGRFFLPGADPMAREYLAEGGELSPLILTWLYNRMHFLSKVIAINQQWVMFSPNVMTEYPVPRFVLLYESGEKRTYRAACDPPEDLLQPVYPFWFNEKNLQICYNVLTNEAVRMGFAHHLSQKYSADETGSPLSQIMLHRVLYQFHPPGSDAAAWYTEQSGPPADQVSEPIWYYEVEQAQGTWIEAAQ
jgi:hypothetical protein